MANTDFHNPQHQSTGMRYPTLAFISGGVGEADSMDGIPPYPFETTCYDLALIQAKIADFNVIPYTSVLPKELYGNIMPVEKVEKHFKHGAVLEVIMSANGARIDEHRAIATGLGICWGQKDGKLVGGWAAEYVEYFPAWIDDEIAGAHAKMWLTKSLSRELALRGMEQYGELQFWHNHLNITKPYGYCMTVMGFLSFRYSNPVML